MWGQLSVRVGFQAGLGVGHTLGGRTTVRTRERACVHVCVCSQTREQGVHTSSLNC